MSLIIDRSFETADQLKVEGNSSYRDGTLLAAYQQYREACTVLHTFLLKMVDPSLLKRADQGSEDMNGNILICQARDQEAVLKGNLAAVFSDVSHGTVNQMVQEAVMAIQDALIGRDRSFISLVKSQPFTRRPVRWDLLFKNLKRRVASLRYFGAHGNVLVDEYMCDHLTDTSLVKKPGKSETDALLRDSEAAFQGYQFPEAVVACPHATPPAKYGYFHLQATCSEASQRYYCSGESSISSNDCFAYEGSTFMYSKVTKKTHVFVVNMETGKAILRGRTLELTRTVGTRRWMMTLCEDPSSPFVLGSALHSVAGEWEGAPFLVGGNVPSSFPNSRIHPDGGELSPLGMHTVWPSRNKVLRKTTGDPPVVTRHGGVVFYQQARFYMFGGMLLVGWEHSTPKLPRGSSCDFIWKLDLNDLVWTEVLYDRDLRSPEPRQGHVTWLWKHYMFIFEGSKALLGDNPEYPRKNLPLGDLWAFDLLSHCWHRVFGTGLHPSARSDMGLAVADEGRRIYIVGGRIGLPTCTYHACVGDDNICSMLTAEVFELDLGDDPLATGLESTTVHWRQVTPKREGALWMSARATPACVLCNIDDQEVLLCMGGHVADHDGTIQPSSTAAVFNFQPNLPSHNLAEKHHEVLLARLKARTENNMRKSGIEQAPSSSAGSDVHGMGSREPSLGVQARPKILDLSSLKSLPRRPGFYASSQGPEQQLLANIHMHTEVQFPLIDAGLGLENPHR